MNSKLEKWMTISALIGWTASMGSLAFLALRTASPATAYRSLPPLVEEPSIRLNSQIAESAHRVTRAIPDDRARELWLNSLRNFSTSPEVALSSLGLSTQAKPASGELRNRLAPHAEPDSVEPQKSN